MTFNQIAQHVRKDAQKRGEFLTLKEAKEEASRLILEGVRDLDDAKEFYSVFKGRETILFTAQGWAVSPLAFQDAMKLARKLAARKITKNPSVRE